MNEIDLISTILEHVETMVKTNRGEALVSEIRLARKMIASMEPYFARDAIKCIFEEDTE